MDKPKYKTGDKIIYNPTDDGITRMGTITGGELHPDWGWVYSVESTRFLYKDMTRAQCMETLVVLEAEILRRQK